MKTFDIFFGSSMVAITTFVYTNSYILLLLSMFIIISYLQFKASLSSKYNGVIIPVLSFALSLFMAFIFKSNAIEIILLLNIPTCVYVLEYIYMRFITKKHIA